MITFPPDDASRDEIIEWCAQQIERDRITDIRGIGARRRRDREDAELRAQTIQETRAELAAHLRAFKSRPDLDPLATLRQVAGLLPDDLEHTALVRNAWPLAWNGLVDIDVIARLNSNSIPPESQYRITITDKGRRMLESEPAA